MRDEAVLAKGQVERIGMADAIISHKPAGGEKHKIVEPILEHTAAIKAVLDALTDSAHGVIADIAEIDAVGHRVVHGGETYSKSVIITAAVKAAIEENIDLAPLHNPPNLKGILASETEMPKVPNVAVFDTAFHSTLPPHAYLYALPYSLYQHYKIRRYGFHGTSHKFVALRAAKVMQRDFHSLKLITCHLGNGASVAAVNCGKSVDTSMGFTPLEGLMMGTRAGDIDPAIIPYVMAKEELSISEVDAMLNKHSGILGVSGLGSDMRDIEDAMEESNERAQLAHAMYCYRIRKYIGAYAAAMNGVDGIIFTGGIGERGPIQRRAICSELTYLGVDFDAEINEFKAEERPLTREGSKVQVWVIPTNEELMIARDTLELVQA